MLVRMDELTKLSNPGIYLRSQCPLKYKPRENPALY